MAEEGGELNQAAIGVNTFLIPPQPGTDGEGVAKIMQPRVCHTGRYFQPQSWHKRVEGQTDRALVNDAALGE